MLTLHLADEVFLACHHEYTGKPRLGGSTLSTLLAGAVLAELILAYRVTVDAAGAIVVQDQGKHGERVADAAMAEILKRRNSHSVRIWIQYLREHSVDMVALRLVEAGLLHPPAGRSGRKNSVHQPTDPLKAGGPIARLHYLVNHPHEADQQSATLGGLLVLAGLESAVSGTSARRVRESLVAVAATLPADMRSLLAAVESVLVSTALGR